jgi:hypothetical protein
MHHTFCHNLFLIPQCFKLFQVDDTAGHFNNKTMTVLRNAVQYITNALFTVKFI